MNKIVMCIVISFFCFSVLSIKEVNAAIIRIHSNRDKIATGEEVKIYGKILPRKSQAIVTVWSSLTSKGKYKKLTTTIANKYGKYSIDLSPEKTKFFKVSYQKKGHKISSAKKKVIVSDDLSIIAPYLIESDIDRVPEAYSSSENAPWGFVHGGVDFVIDSGSIPVQAVTDGMVSEVVIAKEETQMGWHVGYCITYGEYSVCYNLETFSQDDAIGDLQTENIFITEGQVVKQGNIIANLIYGGSGAHIDFGVGHGGTRVCPEPYFTQEARESVMRLITQSNPDWVMCYE